ncbi:MAG: hypothetical protein CMH46_00170 [Muricauda sp.]|nr:hypothetical protein [Allomuricauda sp.]
MVRLRNGKQTNNIGFPKKFPKECSICFNTLNYENYIQLNCEHIFCPCILAWFNKCLTCPICRSNANGFKGHLSKPLNMPSLFLEKAKRDMKILVAFLTITFFIIYNYILYGKTIQSANLVIDFMLVVSFSFCFGIIRQYI